MGIRIFLQRTGLDKIVYNIKIRNKIIFMALFAIIMSVVFIVSDLIKGKKEITELEANYHRNEVPADKYKKIRAHLTDIEAGITGSAAGLTDPSSAAAQLDGSVLAIVQLWEDASVNITDEDLRKEEAHFGKGLNQLKAMCSKLKNAYGKISLENDYGPIKEYYREWSGIRQDMLVSLDKIIAKTELAITNYYGSTKTLREKANFFIIFGSIVGLGLFFIMAACIIHSINNSISTVVKAAKEVADGNLASTIELDSKDELGVMAGELNKMLIKLNQSFSTILGEAERIYNHAEGLSDTAEFLISGSNEQQREVNCVMDLSSNISDSITGVARNAVDASSATNASFESAQQGSEVVKQTKKSISELAATVDKISDSISGLVNSSKKIGDIISVIQGIADQTNLLALNAAIEAARAGDQGRGFAVVANEVKKLAENTTEATDEVTQIIRTIQNETEEVISTIQQSKAVASAAISTASDAGSAHEKIVSSSKNIMGMVQEIASATEAQAASANHVTQSMGQISVVIQQTSILSENIKNVADELSSVSKQLKTEVISFKIQAEQAASRSGIDHADTTNEHSLPFA